MDENKLNFLKCRPFKELEQLRLEVQGREQKSKKPTSSANEAGQTHKRQVNYSIESSTYSKNQSLISNQVMDFPLEIFPKPIKSFIEEAAQSLQCPADFIAVSVLVCAGVAIGNSREVEVKEGWREGARLYCGIVAEPGSKKTPAMKKALSAIYKIQEQLEEQYQKEIFVFEEENSFHELEKKKWKKDKRKMYEGFKNVERTGEIIKPKPKQIFTSDATWEALSKVLEDNENGVLFFKDELIAWVNSMDQYRSKGSDRQNWLSIWSGEPIIINRKEERINIPRPFVNVIGGLQPDVLEQLIKSNINDGFIDRILFSFPDSSPSYWSEISLREETMLNYQKVIYELYRLKGNGKGSPVIIKFQKEAKKEFVNWYDNLQKEMHSAGFSEELKGTWAKMPGYFLRLALIIHLLRYTCKETKEKEVDEVSILVTCELTDYFKSHAKKVFNILKSDHLTKKIFKIINYIRDKGTNNSIKLRDLLHANVAGVRNMEEVNTLLKHVEVRGYGKFASKKNMNGTKSKYFTLNSNL